MDKISPARDPEGTLTAPPEGTPGSPSGSGISGLAGQSAITGIRVEKQGGHSARISWTASPRNQSPIYIGRYSKPIDTRELLFEAENLTTPPLSASQLEFLDTNIPDGAYYYAVVTADEINSSAGPNRNRLSLRPNVNYTTVPLVIRREEVMAGAHADRVTGLSAVNTDRTVKLNWIAPRSGGSFYIYRGKDAFQTPDSFSRAIRIGATAPDTPFFTDTTPLTDEKVYYAVTTIRSGREDRSVFLNESYIEHVFKPTFLSAELSRKLPEGLSAFVQSRNHVKLLWVDPIEDFTELRIYRQERPITSTAELGRSRLIASVRKNVRTHLDRNLAPGRYFYAVLPVGPSGEIITEFYEGRTITANPIEIRGTTSGPRIEYLEVRLRDDRVRIKFDAYKENATSVKYFIYRSTRLMETASDIRNHGRLIKEQEDEDDVLDTGLPAGSYYYAILMEADGELLETMAAGKNYIEKPILIGPGSGPATEMPDLETVLNRTYRRSHFGDAVRELQIFLAPHVPAEIRARAMLYTGLSYYQLGHYQSSLRAFMDDNLRRHYPDRARFWYDRSLERLRK
ncbi:MAG: hypothetical protein HS115_08345 [Spirochaetales bacterium]|nr:hypothetical protein [Spirochaetales bacterium]